MRTLLLSTAAALVLAAPAPLAWAQTSPTVIVVEGTETAPADLVGQTVHATFADRSDLSQIDAIPPDWLPVGVIEGLSEGGDVAIVAFEQGTMVPDQPSRAEVGAERLRLVPASGEPQGYAVLFDAEGTPLAGRLESLERDRLAALAQASSPLFQQTEPAPVAQAAESAEALAGESVTVEGATEGMPVTAGQGTTVQETTTGAASSPTAGDSGLVAGPTQAGTTQAGTTQAGTDGAARGTGPAEGLAVAGAAAVGDTPAEQAAAADASGELEPGAGSATGIEPVGEAGGMQDTGTQGAGEAAEPPTVTGTGTLLGTTPSPEEADAQDAATGTGTAADPATSGTTTVVTTDPSATPAQAQGGEQQTGTGAGTAPTTAMTTAPAAATMDTAATTDAATPDAGTAGTAAPGAVATTGTDPAQAGADTPAVTPPATQDDAAAGGGATTGTAATDAQAGAPATDAQAGDQAGAAPTDPQAGAAPAAPTTTTTATTTATQAPATGATTSTAVEPDTAVPATAQPETETGAAQEGLREEPIADPSLPPIENAENVVPEGTLTDRAPLQAETGLDSPSQTAPTPLLPTDQAIAETSAPAGATAMMRPAGAPEGFEPVDMATLDPAQLLQVRVYSADGDDIGTIDRWVGEREGMLPEGAVVDVGGFLGVGSRRIAIASELMTLTTEAGTNDRRLYVGLTRAQIDAIPASAD